MTEAAAAELAHLQAVWLARFGEPPPIVAEPEIMRRVMARVLERTGAESPPPAACPAPAGWPKLALAPDPGS